MVKRFGTDAFTLEDFEERTNDFLGYFNSLTSARDKAMIRDRASFKFVLEKCFTKDPSLKYWVSNIGQDVTDAMFETDYVESIVERNLARKGKFEYPSLESRRRMHESVKEVSKREVVRPSVKRFVTARVKGRLVKALAVTVRIKGKEYRRFRDAKTGRWSSVKKDKKNAR